MITFRSCRGHHDCGSWPVCQGLGPANPLECPSTSSLTLSTPSPPTDRQGWMSGGPTCQFHSSNTCRQPDGRLTKMARCSILLLFTARRLNRCTLISCTYFGKIFESSGSKYNGTEGVGGWPVGPPCPSHGAHMHAAVGCCLRP
jgi:hypothetical protein